MSWNKIRRWVTSFRFLLSLCMIIVGGYITLLVILAIILAILSSIVNNDDGILYSLILLLFNGFMLYCGIELLKQKDIRRDIQ
jgi:hypothetical protein